MVQRIERKGEGFRKDKNLKDSRHLVAVNRLFLESISTRNVSVSTVFSPGRKHLMARGNLRHSV